jgi:NAD(P)-dependent dehydrogenase (short-subunit alcohol dehydrogenase family)
MLTAGFAGKPELYAQLEACHPQGRIGQPEEVARLALAMAEGGMRFLHGACVGLDGGIGSRLFDPD